MIQDAFDAVVIGSGFGGAVAACRLAQAGLQVCLFERGRRYPMGSFPRSMDDAAPWLYGESSQGLIDIKPLRTEMLALQVAGYGGGSLLYNNVHIRLPSAVFAQGWPAGFSRQTLDPYYDLAAYMLDLVPLSEEQPLGLPHRTKLLKKAAESLGRKEQFFLPNLAIDFSAPGVSHRNKFGVEQQGCTHCGECITGCNRHAKNTVDLNYLAVAEQRGATIRTQCQVHRIEPDGHGYRVAYKDLAAGGVLGSVAAHQVFLCAGAINSTELLLRCRDEHGSLRNLSDRLGHGYSANGDFLAFVFRSREPLLPSAGPGITSALLYERGQGEQKIWCLLEDGGAPKDMVLRGQIFDSKHPQIYTGRALWDDVLRGIGAQPKETPTDPNLDSCIALLLMGQDRASGRISIDSLTGQLRMRWELEPNLPLYSAQTRLAADVAKALGGEIVYNPFWKQLHQPMTIHNLGGCPMADSKDAGVTSGIGEVFGHPGLFVLDGAIMPMAVGPNPSHTIAAVAERSIETIIRRITRNPTWQAPERALAKPIPEPMDKVFVPHHGTAEPAHRFHCLSFQETMRGFVKKGHIPVDDYLGAARAGEANAERMEFTLDISAPDLDSFLQDRDHTAIANGKLFIAGFTDAAGAEVQGGVFNLFVEGTAAGSRKMLYALPFYGQDGRPYLLDGWKDIRDHGGFSGKLDAWESLTTLYTVIREGHSRQGDVRATGVLRIDLAGVLKLTRTMQISGSPSAIERASAIERFGRAFFGTLWKVYIQPRLATW